MLYVYLNWQTFCLFAVADARYHMQDLPWLTVLRAFRSCDDWLLAGCMRAWMSHGGLAGLTKLTEQRGMCRVCPLYAMGACAHAQAQRSQIRTMNCRNES